MCFDVDFVVLHYYCTYCRKFTCYEFKDLNLGDKLVAIAPYGGPIGTYVSNANCCK